jgi:hypothetical protein
MVLDVKWVPLILQNLQRFAPKMRGSSSLFFCGHPAYAWTLDSEYPRCHGFLKKKQ